MNDLPQPETMLTYASILEKPQYWVDPRGQKWLLATGEIIEAACAALRFCASLSLHTEYCMNERCPRGGTPVEVATLSALTPADDVGREQGPA